MVGMSDAAWGVRRNSESQGGYLVLLCHKSVLEDNTLDHDYTILDWELQATKDQSVLTECREPSMLSRDGRLGIPPHLLGRMSEL